MGSCLCRSSSSLSEVEHERQVVSTGRQNMIKVVTTTGGMMELYAPITADQITSEFPDHGLFLISPDTSAMSHSPLLRKDHLHPGQLYYLLPLKTVPNTTKEDARLLSTPYRYRMSSFDNPYHHPKVVQYKRKPSASASEQHLHHHQHQHHADVVPRHSSGSGGGGGSGGRGVWKVRLVINPEQLSEILSQESRTEELIESVRTVAKCGTSSTTNNNNNNGSSSVAPSSNNSDDHGCGSSSVSS